MTLMTVLKIVVLLIVLTPILFYDHEEFTR